MNKKFISLNFSNLDSKESRISTLSIIKSTIIDKSFLIDTYIPVETKNDFIDWLRKNPFISLYTGWIAIKEQIDSKLESIGKSDFIGALDWKIKNIEKKDNLITTHYNLSVLQLSKEMNIDTALSEISRILSMYNEDTSSSIEKDNQIQQDSNLPIDKFTLEKINKFNENFNNSKKVEAENAVEPQLNFEDGLSEITMIYDNGNGTAYIDLEGVQFNINIGDMISKDGKLYITKALRTSLINLFLETYGLQNPIIESLIESFDTYLGKLDVIPTDLNKYDVILNSTSGMQIIMKADTDIGTLSFNVIDSEGKSQDITVNISEPNLLNNLAKETLSPEYLMNISINK